MYHILFYFLSKFRNRQNRLSQLKSVKVMVIPEEAEAEGDMRGSWGLITLHLRTWMCIKLTVIICAVAWTYT